MVRYREGVGPEQPHHPVFARLPCGRCEVTWLQASKQPARKGVELRTLYLIRLRWHRYMSAEWAVLLSSLAFGAAHLSARDFPQLTALGIVMGFSYVRSRNLLTPMAIHGAWNGVVLTLLFVLSANGYDLTDIPSW